MKKIRLSPVLKKVIIGLFIFLNLLILTVLLFKEQAINYVLNKVITDAKKNYQVDLHFGQIEITGFNEINLNEISAVPEGRDTLIRINQLGVSIRYLPLLLGRIQINELSITNGNMNLVRQNGQSNFDFLFRKKEKTDTTARGNLNIARVADQLINQLLYKVPQSLSITNFTVRLIDDSIQLKIINRETNIINHKFSSSSTLYTSSDTSIVIAKGFVDAGNKQLNLSFYAENKALQVPYIDQKYGFVVRFDTLSTTMDDVRFESQELKVFGSWSVKKLVVNYPRIALNDVIVDDASINCNMFFGKNYISIDSSSVLKIKKLMGHPFAKYTFGQPKLYELKFNTEKCDAQDFFDAFPHGMFESLEGIKVSGNLTYSLDFMLDSSLPDSVKFNSTLAKENFKILKFGKANLQKINSTFMYTPYEYGRPMRTLEIGLGNVYFIPFQEIPNTLKEAILISEDGSFFWHKGFNEEAFRKAIGVNYAAKRFVKGASTISMQLVKNIYLSRKKTISRKVEEMLIVWLIENNYLSSKQRMFEVYLNIIEWGPNIYGIGEASHFYFNKWPDKLTLGESLFLCSIVPRPKFFKYAFMADGKLKPYNNGHFQKVSRRMLRKGVITEADTVGMLQNVQLTGYAKNFIIPAKNINPDSLTTDIDD